jgi:uncharacterized protein (DUF2236 family)
MDGMLSSGAIVVSPPALEMSRFLLQAPRPTVAPLFSWVRILTAGLLPARVRDGFELPFRTPERAIFTATGLALRPIYRLTPRPLRWVPAYVSARARVEGRPPSRTSKLVEKLAMRGIATATSP